MYEIFKYKTAVTTCTSAGVTDLSLLDFTPSYLVISSPFISTTGPAKNAKQRE